MTETAVNMPVRYGNENEYSAHQRLTYTALESINDLQEILPRDPRLWSRQNVAQWLQLISLQHGLPEVATSKFLMNGKALCLMTPSMFLSRVPLGGKLLYKDFQLRLSSFLYNQSQY